MSLSRSLPHATEGSSPRRLVHPLVSILSLALLCSGSFASAMEIEPSSLKAAGKGSAILRIDEFGRYSVWAESGQGTAIQMIDRMTGPGQWSGEIGVRDGRVDLFLERGEYKIVTAGHDLASGDVRLEAEPFVEVNVPSIPLLEELKLVESELADLQQRSYWIEIKERRKVILEAAGRCLAELRLWKDGAWLLEATPLRVGTPYLDRQKPLNVLYLEATLDPGLYQVRTYGGPPNPWSTDSDQHPLYLRSGIPDLGPVSRGRYEMSPFGIDRFHVSRESNYFELALPDGGEAGLKIGQVPSLSTSIEGPVAANFIQQETLYPSTRLYEQGEYVSVETFPGTPYILQHFQQQEPMSIQGDGDYWISTVQSGFAGDAVDSTGMLIALDGQGLPAAASVVVLSPETEFVRRVNLSGFTTLFLEVAEAGSYEFKIEGIQCRARIEPFFPFAPPSDYSPPAYQGDYSVWDLPAGRYILAVEPYSTGVADIMIRPRSLLGSLMEWAGLGDTPSAAAAPAGGVIIPKVSLSPRKVYQLFLNERPGVEEMVVVRKLPLDLSQPLPLAQRPGETIQVPFQARERGSLTARAEDGSSLDVSLDGSNWSSSASVTRGRHTAYVRSTADVTLQYTLRLEPTRLSSAAPLPELPSGSGPKDVAFPDLSVGSTAFLDLGRDSEATFHLHADEPALYKLASTGLLAVEGNLRSRTVTSLGGSAEGGVGRNFSIQRYLGPGDYQLTVRPRGRSKGHLGVSAEKSATLKGGRLVPGQPQRISLPADRGVEYTFEISQSGRYHLQTLGLVGKFMCRLEDEDGWPLVRPNDVADISYQFEAGKYRFILLPETTAARAVTLLKWVEETRQTEGHGPHPLTLNTEHSHVWLEPAGNAERQPDQWLFSLPADVDAEVRLTGGMRGELHLLDAPDGNSTGVVASVSPSRPWSGSLPTGSYRLDAVSSRKNNKLRYTVSLQVQQLVAGLEREVTGPSRIPLSVGVGGLVRISSFGSSDVKARLLDAVGRQLAFSDDRQDDWNFDISERLAPGTYFLDVAPVGSAPPKTMVSMQILADAVKTSEPLPMEKVFDLSETAAVIPLQLPAAADLLAVMAESEDVLGLTLEAQIAGAWRELETVESRHPRIELPFPGTARVGPTGPDTPGYQLIATTPYRLRLWSSTGKVTSATVRGAAVNLAAQSEAQLTSGQLLLQPPPTAPWVRLGRIQLTRPGMFRLVEVPDKSRWSDASSPALSNAGRQLISGIDRELWVSLPGETSEEDARVKLERVILGSNDEAAIQIELPPATLQMCDLNFDPGSFLIAQVTAQTGQPGVGLLRDGEEPVFPSAALMAAGTHSALSVSLQSSGVRLATWNAGRFPSSLEAQLITTAVPTSSADRVEGDWEGRLEGISSRTLALASGQKQIRLSLGPNLVAVLARGDTIESVHWLDDQPFSETLFTRADHLSILHRGAGQSNFVVSVLNQDRSARNLALTFEQPLETRFAASGILRVPVNYSAAADSGPWLETTGSIESVLLLGDNGVVLRKGDALPRQFSGSAVISHETGLGLAWLEIGETYERLFGKMEPRGAARITTPKEVPLTGEVHSFEIDFGRPSVVHLRGAGEALSRLVTSKEKGALAWVEIHSDQIRLDAYLPEGMGIVQLRAFSGSKLSGVLEISRSDVRSIGEGLGPETLLPPGSTRFFSFQINETGKVGVGVRASSEVVEAEVLTSTGKVLGTGTVQFLDLDPGRYLLSLKTPVDAPPVAVRPALAGISPPGTDPPEDVIESYMRMDAQAIGDAESSTAPTDVEGGEDL